MNSFYKRVILLILILLTSSNSVLAEDVSFQPAKQDNLPVVTANLPLSQIGQLKLNQGMIHIDGTEVTVGAVPDWLFDEHKVLSGYVLNSSIVMSGSDAFIKGDVYFTKGEWLNYLAKSTSTDLINFTNQNPIYGRLIGFNPPDVSIQLNTGLIKNYPLASIKSIDSQRCYSFTIPTKIPKINAVTQSVEGQAYKITLTPSQRYKQTFYSGLTCNKTITPKSNLAGTESEISKKFIGLLIGVSVFTDIAPFIAIPATFGPQGQFNRARNQLNNFNITSQSQSNQQTIQLIQQYAVLKP